MPKRKSYSYYDDFYYPPSRPIEAEGGIKAHNQRGSFAKNWWASKWIAALERFMDSGRLSRGRSYARKGQVLSIEEKGGKIAAQVQGSRPKPYKVTIELSPLSNRQWEAVIDALAEQALFSAQLLAGEMPQDIESAFDTAGVSLFPSSRGDLETDCSCPDWANPCKHVAATHYLLGERFDEDPFLLFRLRGRAQEQILDALRQRRAGQDAAEDELEEAEEETFPPLEEGLDKFWEVGEPWDELLPVVRPVFETQTIIELPILKRLGEPPFPVEPSLESRLAPAYRAIRRGALRLAFADQEETNSD